MTAAALNVSAGAGALHAAAASLDDPRIAAVQGQLDAYNVQDIDAYMAFFADDCVIADFNGAVTSNGAAAIRERYVGMFAKFPQNKAELLNRIVMGNTVADHELVKRAPDGEQFEALAIYTIRDGRIVRVDFAK
jgi:hypothetical protein